VLVVAGLTLAACGASDGDGLGATASTSVDTNETSVDTNETSGTEPPTVTERVAPSAPPETTAASASPATAPATDGAVDACAALPSLEEISSVMGTGLSTTTPLERGPASDLCEAGGAADGVANVQFSRTADTTREQTEALAAELGYPVTDLGDPALPGGFTYASAAAVNIDGTEYLVQAIGLDTMGDPNSPVATARSARLLVLWLANLGVTPVS